MSEPGPRVLVVDDEPAIRTFLRTILSAHDYTVFEAARGQAAVEAVVSQRPDLIVLDIGLPDMDGVAVTRILREWSQIPILILSVRGSEQDKIAALDAGADDYLTKPFGSGELLARIRVLLRRGARATNEPLFSLGALQVDLAKRVVMLEGQEVQLTPTEYDLLRTLVNHAGQVLTHHFLLRQVWALSMDDDALHMLRVNISNLRHKLEPDPARPRYLVTEAGVGYRLRTEA